MGCTISDCCKNSESQSDLADERTHLLNDPVCNSSSVQRVQSDDLASHYPNSSPKGTDEQSVLNKILQETATNVIDVAALAPTNIEQNEYLERRSHYSLKLSSLPMQISIRRPCYLIDIAVPEKMLTPTPISTENVLLIKRASSKIKGALNDLKVYHTEDLIVPFEIP
ncbi:unnamed protein product [Nezara viridula]|uniref:Ragulator complex protein LAMTOR1 n=1 Tax=Nezara viridula TaxID=85310 RepID=A0A9P0GZ23_NEZVI|nr:unnamed protein product [Nezara viridula]